MVSVFQSPLMMVAHGRLSLTTAGNYSLSGSYGNQRRIYAVVTNRDATNAILVTKSNGTEVDTVFPLTKVIFHGDDPLLLNSDTGTVSGNAVEYYVNESGPADQARAQNFSGGGAASSGGGGTGGTGPAGSGQGTAPPGGGTGGAGGFFPP